jgi:hypothetical protein
LYGYVDVVLFGLLFLACGLVSGPEEDPADGPDEEDYGQEEKDKGTFAH